MSVSVSVSLLELTFLPSRLLGGARDFRCSPPHAVVLVDVSRTVLEDSFFFFFSDLLFHQQFPKIAREFFDGVSR